MPAQANNLALLLARLAMAALFLPSGIGKLWGLAPFTALLRERGLPFPGGLAILAAAAETLAPIALVLGLAPRITAAVLIVFTLVATFVSHRYWSVADLPARAAQSASFYKNIAIVGGLLAYGAAGPGAWSLARLGGRSAAQPHTESRAGRRAAAGAGPRAPSKPRRR